MTTETASEDDNFGTAQSNKVKLLLPVVPLVFNVSALLGFFFLKPAWKACWKDMLNNHVLCSFYKFLEWIIPFCDISFQAIINALGVERRNRVLAGLYMGRSDTQLVVRQASLHVWKIVVSNTPRTLREILPTLFGLLLKFLASTCADKRTVRICVMPSCHCRGLCKLMPEEQRMILGINLSKAVVNLALLSISTSECSLC